MMAPTPKGLELRSSPALQDRPQHADKHEQACRDEAGGRMAEMPLLRGARRPSPSGLPPELFKSGVCGDRTTGPQVASWLEDDYWPEFTRQHSRSSDEQYRHAGALALGKAVRQLRSGAWADDAAAL